MCYELGQHIKVDNPLSYFTGGMFSILDVLLDQPMEVLIPKLPLSNELQDALIHEQGQMGDIIKCVKAYESGDWGQVMTYREELGLPDLKQIFIDSAKTTEKIKGSI